MSGRDHRRHFVARKLPWIGRLGLTLKGSRSGLLVVHGHVRQVWVEIERQDGEPKAKWTVRAKHSAIPFNLGFRREGLADTLKRWAGAGDYRSGDPAFDSAVEVAGPPAVVSAVLTPELRRLIVKWTGAGLEVRDGQLTWVHRDGPTGREIQAAVLPLVKIANGLRHGQSSSRRRLVRNVLRPDLPGVRRVCLTRLLADPGLRVTGAQLAEIIDALRDADDGVDFSGAIRDAYVYQARHHPERFADATLDTVIDLLAGDMEHQLVALPVLAERGGPEALPAVVRLTSGLLVATAVKTAARSAAAAIMARTGGEAGGLAVVEDAGGGLTVSE